MTKMEKQLQGIVLDAPCQIGGAIFQTGIEVLSAIQKAQADYAYQANKNATATVAAVSTREPQWFDDMYRDVAVWCVANRKRLPIAEILDDFFVVNVRDVEPEDRKLFLKRVYELLV